MDILCLPGVILRSNFYKKLAVIVNNNMHVHIIIYAVIDTGKEARSGNKKEILQVGTRPPQR